MNIGPIREGLQAMLESVAGIKGASGWPTESVGSPPFAYVGFDTATVTVAAGLETWLHTLPINVLVNRKGANLPNEMQATEDVIAALLAAIRADQDLGQPGIVGYVLPEQITEGVFQFAGVDYTGFVLSVEVKETAGVSYA